ncbi:MAG: GtrA family protein, partial [Oscillospiraceae bacterium]
MIIDKKLLKQLFRFAVVGGTAFLIDYGILYALTEWVGLYYLLSAMVSFMISTVFNYIASVKWVFDVNKKHSGERNFAIFVLFSVIGLGIN